MTEVQAQSLTGIDVSGKVIVLEQLQADLIAGGVSVPVGIAIVGPPVTDPVFPPPSGPLPPPCPEGSKLFNYDAGGHLEDLPPEAQTIVDSYVAVAAVDTRTKARKDIKDATTLTDLETAILEIV